jgi:hypothetical protein
LRSQFTFSRRRRRRHHHPDEVARSNLIHFDISLMVSLGFLLPFGF